MPAKVYKNGFLFSSSKGLAPEAGFGCDGEDDSSKGLELEGSSNGLEDCSNGLEGAGSSKGLAGDSSKGLD